VKKERKESRNARLRRKRGVFLGSFPLNNKNTEEHGKKEIRFERKKNLRGSSNGSPRGDKEEGPVGDKMT